MTPDIDQIQAYAYWFFTIFLVVLLYSYILHLYRRERKGEQDYEKYGRLALDDELTDTPIESRESETDTKKENNKERTNGLA